MGFLLGMFMMEYRLTGQDVCGPCGYGVRELSDNVDIPATKPAWIMSEVEKILQEDPNNKIVRYVLQDDDDSLIGYLFAVDIVFGYHVR